MIEANPDDPSSYTSGVGAILCIGTHILIFTVTEKELMRECMWFTRCLIETKR